MKFLRTAMLIGVIFALVGCSRSGKFEGKWVNAGTGETVEFKKDDTGIFLVPNRPSLSFSWVAVENDRVKIDISFQGGKRTLFGRLDDGSLVLEGAGQKALYRKAP